MTATKNKKFVCATLCTANVTRKKNRVKSYGDLSSVEPLKYFLKDGEEFEIELFNPTQSQKLAKININGKLISNSGIVLNPGQRVYLERFIDTDQKFIFKTYSVENSEETSFAIAKNGEISIEFFDEVTKPNIVLGGNTYWNYPYYNGFSYPRMTLTNTGGTVYGNNSSIAGDILNGGLINSSFTSPTVNTFYSSVSSTSSFTDNGNVSMFSADISSINPETSKPQEIETGRISGGTASNQSFETVYGEFNIFATNIVKLQILPDSQKPIEASEIRNYCTSCKCRIKKSSWKFCPTCGESLE